MEGEGLRCDLQLSSWKPGALGLITSLQNALPPSGLSRNGWSLINQVQPNLVGKSSASLSDPFVPCTSIIGDYMLFTPCLAF